MRGWSYHGADHSNSVPVIAAKAGLRSALPALRPRLEHIVEESLRLAAETKDTSGTLLPLSAVEMLITLPGWSNLPIATLAKKLTSNMNAAVVLGKELC